MFSAEFDFTGARTHRFGLPLDRWERFHGRSYWITGAGTGFGQAISLALAAADAQIFLTSRRVEKLEETIDAAVQLGASRDNCHALPADITDDGQIARTRQLIEVRSDRLHGVVNNAAVPQRSTGPWPLHEEIPSYWDELMNVNVKAPLMVTRAALPSLVAAEEIKVLFMTSAAGWSFAPGFGHYNVSKAALNALVGSLAAECSARYSTMDVQINGLDPGQAKTEMNQGATRRASSVVPMALTLLSHPPGGPNGKFFAHDGRHLTFCNSTAYERQLM